MNYEFGSGRHGRVDENLGIGDPVECYLVFGDRDFEEMNGQFLIVEDVVFYFMCKGQFFDADNLSFFDFFGNEVVSETLDDFRANRWMQMPRVDG